jgi:TRC40/GET3/ArsA family transport-energizing ATPase
VTLPEELSVAETGDALATFDRTGLPVAEIVINRVLPQGEPCPICDRRRANESAAIATIRRSVARGRPMRMVPAVGREPRGIRALAAIGASLRGAPPGRRPATAASSAPPRGSAVSLDDRVETIAAERLEATTGAELLFFGGKGGVGKTTVAAAVAIRLAGARPGARVLLLSTDPAHSLADVLGASVSDNARPIAAGPRNLLVREVDAPRALAARRADLEAALDEIASAFGTGAASTMHARDLMELAPPGVDELFGILSVFEARSDYDVIIVDTAPTGHALRLLEMPEVARQWVQALLRVLLKYRSLVRPGQLAAELVKLSQSIRELQALLRDEVLTRFIVVTRAAEVPRAETERLLMRLRRRGVDDDDVVVGAGFEDRQDSEQFVDAWRRELHQLAGAHRAGRVSAECGRDFIERGFDVAVHTTPIRDSNLVTRRIANLRWLLCASPAYLKEHGAPETPRELARHQCLVHINSDPSDRVWRLRSGNGQVSIKVQGPFASNSVLMLRKAALESLGIGILPFYCVKEDLKSGALQEVLGSYPIPAHPLSLVFSTGKPTPQKIRLLGDFLIDWFRKRPIPH